MNRFISIAAATILAFAASPAVSGESGTMDLMPSGEWAKVMPDKELATKRGGFFNLAFSAMLTVQAQNGTSTTGGPVVPTTGLPPATQIGIQNDQVQVSAFVGSIQNFSGILNIVQVPGSFNVVNTQLTVQISIINVLNASQIPALSSLFQTR